MCCVYLYHPILSLPIMLNLRCCRVTSYGCYVFIIALGAAVAFVSLFMYHLSLEAEIKALQYKAAVEVQYSNLSGKATACDNKHPPTVECALVHDELAGLSIRISNELKSESLKSSLGHDHDMDMQFLQMLTKAYYYQYIKDEI